MTDETIDHYNNALHSSYPSAVNSDGEDLMERNDAHEQTVAIDAMSNEYKNKPNANLRMRELGSMRSRVAKEK